MVDVAGNGMGPKARAARHGQAVMLWLLSICLALVLYRGGLHGPMLLDDYPQLGSFFDAPGDGNWQAQLLSNSGPFGRPVAMATFVFNSIVSGPDLAAWKLTNVLLHLLCSACILGLVLSLGAGRAARRQPSLTAPAALVAAAWLLHPLQVSTVLYTVQRMTQLSALFCLAGMWCYAAGRSRQLESGRGRVRILLAYLLFLPLAVLSKENGLLLPLYLLLIEGCFFRFQGEPSVRRFTLWTHAVFFALPVLAALLWGALHFQDRVLAAYIGAGFTLPERVLTESRVMVLYVREILLPWPGWMGFYHDDLSLSTGLLTPPTTLFSLLALIGLGAIAYGLRRRMPAACFGIAFFFAGHLLESGIFALELMFEHRNYLPALGLILAAATILNSLPAAPAIRGALALAVIFAFAVLTQIHVRAWSSEGALYAFVEKSHPHSPRLAADLAGARTTRGDYDAALALLAPQATTGAALQSAYIVCLRNRELTPELLPALAQKVQPPVNTYVATGLIELGRLGLERQCRFDRRQYLELQRAVQSLPMRDPALRVKLLMWTAQYQWDLLDRPGALATLEQAFRLTPTDPVPLFLAAEWSLDAGNRGQAVAFYQRASAVAQSVHRDYRDLSGPLEARLARSPAS